MVRIPLHLLKEDFRFVLVPKKQKGAFESFNWKKEKNVYKYDDPKLITHLKKEGNYGVLGGPGGLICIDADCKEAVEIMEQLPETLTIQSSKEHKKHYYFTTKEGPINEIIQDKNKEELISIRGDNRYIVGPSSVHPSGAVYKVIKNSKIAEVTHKQILNAIKTLKPLQKEKTITQKKEDPKTNNIEQELRISQIITQTGQGAHPFHGSDGGINFTVDDNDITWHCWRCDTTGNAWSLLAQKLKLVQCGDSLKNSPHWQKLYQYAENEGWIKKKTYVQSSNSTPPPNPSPLYIYFNSNFNFKIKNNIYNTYPLGEDPKYKALNVGFEMAREMLLSQTNPQYICTVCKTVHNDIAKGGILLSPQVCRNEDCLKTSFDLSFDKDVRLYYPAVNIKRVILKNNIQVQTTKKPLLLGSIVRTTKSLQTVLLGEKKPFKAFPIVEVKTDFYRYKGVGGDNLDYILLSTEELPLAELEVEGVVFDLSDDVDVGENGKIQGYQKTLLVTGFKQLDKAFTEEEYLSFTQKHSWDDIELRLFEGSPHPKIYKDFLSSGFISSKHNGHGLNLGVFGDPASVKTTVLKGLKKALGEEDHFNGSNSTMKGLVVSYNIKPVNLGVYLGCNRVTFADEFFKVIAKDLEGGYGDRTRAFLGVLVNYLDNSEETYSSGNTVKVKVQAKSKMWFFSNWDVGGNMPLLLSELNHYEWARRNWFYVISKAHENFYEQNFCSLDSRKEPNITTKEFLRLYDFWQKNPIVLEKKHNESIRKYIRECRELILEDTLKTYFTVKNVFFHLVRFLDGIVKKRCYVEKSFNFKVKTEDMVELTQLVLFCLKSWNPSNRNYQDWNFFFSKKELEGYEPSYQDSGFKSDRG